MAFTLLGNLSRHVKSVHHFCSLVSQTSKVVLSLQVSSRHEFFPSFIPLASLGWLQAPSSSILRFFESCFTCTHLFHRIRQAIQDKVKQAFHLPFDWIVRNPTNKLKWFIFLLLYRCFLCYIQGGHSSQWKVSVHFRRFMVDDWSFFWRNLHVPHVHPILTTHGKILRPLVFINV
jgi:hypothetical protein